MSSPIAPDELSWKTSSVERLRFDSSIASFISDTLGASR
jgi:hypothetical protein